MSARPGFSYWRERRNARAAMTTFQSGVAACVLDGLGDRAAAAALGRTPKAVENAVLALRVKYGADNRVLLALALEREGRVSTDVR